MIRSVLVLDCGATNVKACLVSETGSVLSSCSEHNATVPDPLFESGVIWDFQEIFDKLSRCVRKVIAEKKDVFISGITATSFGVDGAIIGDDGKVIYPVISWQCSRTRESEKHLSEYFDPELLYKETGLQSYHFNTINKLIWLRENKPDVFRNGCRFVMMPSLILWLLSGEMVTDVTMAGTTNMTSLNERKFYGRIFQKLNLEEKLFPPLAEPGTVIGKISDRIAESLGVPKDIPVITSGHDTQFAIIGSGAGINEPVLSSGTWEILMARALVRNIKIPSIREGITIELDAIAGIADIGVQWVASGVTEWLGRLLFHEPEGPEKYTTMIGGAEKIDAGAEGLLFIPEIYPGGLSGKKGTIEGFSQNTTRSHIYRSALEALCYYTRFALEKLMRAADFKADKILCVGGGSKNFLWNRLRASILGIPLYVPDIPEATATGAAMIAFTGLGIYNSLPEASSVMLTHRLQEYLPGPDHLLYDDLYHQYSARVF